MSDPASGSRPALWIITAALFFAIMGAITHSLGTRCDWLTIALVRAVFMFGTSVAVAVAVGTELVVWRPRTLWIRSLAGSFSLVCSFYALSRLPLGDVLTLTNTYPLWIVMLSWLSMRRRPGAGDAMRVACGLAGVALIEQPHLSGDQFAAAVALASSVFAAVAMIGLHRLRGVDTRAVVAHFAAVASLVAGAWLAARVGGLVDRGPGLSLGQGQTTTPPYWPGFDPYSLALLFGVGVTGTVGQIFLTKAYAAGPPARVAVLGLTQVVFAMGLDVVLWHRVLSPASLAGTALVVAPTAWLLARSGGRAPAPSPPAAGPVALDQP